MNERLVTARKTEIRQTLKQTLGARSSLQERVMFKKFTRPKRLVFKIRKTPSHAKIRRSFK